MVLPAVTSLSRSIRPLVLAFNRSRGLPRLLALVSPTCPECLSGARAVHRVLTREGRDAELAAMIVWIEMLPEDREADISVLAQEMSDSRIRWFHDPRRHAGRAIATSLGAAGEVAWDVYLFFDSQAEWKSEPPAPRLWVHQLSDPWADPTRRRSGDQLEPELASLLKRMLSPQLAA